MATINTIYIKKESVEKLLDILNAKGLNGIELSCYINDDSNQYGKNVRLAISQTKEERANDLRPTILGYGRTIWSNKNDYIPSKSDGNKLDDDLPF